MARRFMAPAPGKFSAKVRPKFQVGEFTDAHREPFTSQDIRFTTKGNVLYAIVLACAQDAVTIRSLSSLSEIPREAISEITLVATRSRSCGLRMNRD